MKSTLFNSTIKKIGGTAFVLFTSLSAMSQTNVYDDIISQSADHTSLTAAITTAGLESALQNSSASLTVFAPDNDAFDDLAADLGTNITGLLALPNLSDILLYHVLGVTASSASITNGDIVTPLNTANTIKLTKTSAGAVYANHAQVETADLTADNGVVHSIDAVILSNETVVDVAIDNSFNSLTAAVVKAELLPALQDPFATYTVFAPSDLAFDNLATALGTDISGLLALPNLSDILLYHVLGAEVASAAITNGDIVDALNTDNTIKMTKTSMGAVYANQAKVTLADVGADNGTVHALDAVILSNETVVDIAIDNGFTSLTAAVVKAELLPALQDPFGTYTVFAPSDQAFDDLATALGTDISGLLALPNLSDILLYHVLGAEVASGAITNGDIVDALNTDNTIKMTKTSMGAVYANQAKVTLADVGADNGTVHAIDGVILPYETVVDVAIDNGFTSLTAAVVKAELLPALTDPLGTYTVFAPTDAAFDNLAANLGTDLAGVLALPNLADVLLYHVLGSVNVASSLSNGNVPTLEGSDVIITVAGGVMVNDANVTLADVTSDNGVVHVIDKVLLPGTAHISEEQLLNVKVYPNPSSDYIKVSFDGSTANGLSIINTNGQVVYHKESISNNDAIDVSGLASGNYTVTFTVNSNSITKRLVVTSDK
ncbi:MAG: fasciclin domain-containing protein [Crocinitomicaceae bacterium]|nr:fasciclin domain-containing protein [Crocinitomicaceae bacterium]